MAEEKKSNPKYCITPEFRAAFANVFEPKSFEDQEPKFSIVQLYPMKTDLSAMKKAAIAAADEKWPGGKWKDAQGKPKVRMPFRDGNEKADLDGYEGMIFVSASSKQRPQVVDQRRNAISKEDNTFFSGCYARASLVAFAYDKMGNKGVSFALQNIQKTRDGEPFSGRKKAEDEFDAIEDGSDDAANYSNSDVGF